jgi:hypothetical protein
MAEMDKIKADSAMKDSVLKKEEGNLTPKNEDNEMSNELPLKID